MEIPKYICAIKVKPCSKEQKEDCLFYNRYGRCDMGRCIYPAKHNPLCIGGFRGCRKFTKTKIGKETYLLYYCNKCNHLLTVDSKKLNKINLKGAIIGKELDKLLDKMKPKTKKKSSNSDIEILKQLLMNVERLE